CACIPGGTYRLRDHKGTGRPTESRASCRDLGRAERCAVYVVRSGFVRASLAYDGLTADERRPTVVVAGLPDSRLDRFPVMSVNRAQHAPAIRLKALGCVIGEPVFDVSIDADAVVVIDGDELGESEGACQRTGFVADALHQATIADEDPRAMIHNDVCRPIELG